MSNKSIRENFLRDTANHSLEIKNDNGVYRALEFSNSGSSTYAFQITTWDGHLAISGDMGSYVFNRVPDMFCFFRNDDLSINPGYWGGKASAESINSKVLEFDSEGTADWLREYLDNMIENGFSKKEHQKAKEDFEDNGLLEPQSEYDFIIAAENSEYINGDWDLRTEMWQQKHSYHFIWCCYAIVWAIQQYDKKKEFK